MKLSSALFCLVLLSCSAWAQSTTQIHGLPASTGLASTDEFATDKNISGVWRTRKLTGAQLEAYFEAATLTFTGAAILDASGALRLIVPSGLDPDSTQCDEGSEEDGRIAVDTSNGLGLPQLCVCDGTNGWVCGIAISAGSDTQVVFNDGGTLGGDAGLTYNKTTDSLTVVGTLAAGTVTGTNVTSGVDPGHTHTGGAVSTNTISQANSSVIVTDAGTGRVDVTLDGAIDFTVDPNDFHATNAAGPSIVDEAASSTNPTLLPDRSAIDTGLGNSTATLGGNGVTTVVQGNPKLSVGASATHLHDAKPLRFEEDDANGTNWLGIRAPSSVSSDLTCILNDAARMFPQTCIEDAYVLNTGDTVNGDLTVTGTVAAGTVTGANVTSGVDPGHTHTGGAVSTNTIAQGNSSVTVTDAGTGKVEISIDGSIDWTADPDTFRATDANGPALMDEAASSTNPTVLPDRSATDTGLGNSTVALGGNGVTTVVQGNPRLSVGASAVHIHDAKPLRFEEDDANGTNWLAIRAPGSVTSDLTCILEDDASFIPDSCVGDGTDDDVGETGDFTAIDTCAEFATEMTGETGTCGSVVLSTAPTLSSPVLAGTPVVGDGAGNDKMEFAEEASNPTCSSGNYYIWANSGDGKLKKCENGSTSNLDNVGVGSSAGTEYDPDNYPAAGALGSGTSDEFTSGATLTWTSQNLDSMGITYELGGAFMDNAGTTDAWHGMTTPSLGDVDFYVATKVTMFPLGATVTQGCGLSLIVEGTAAAPTEINSIDIHVSASNTLLVQHYDHDDYDMAGLTSIASETIVTEADELVFWRTTAVYFLLIFEDGGDDVAAYWSKDGIIWAGMGQDTTTGIPVAIGLFNRDNADCFFEWVREFSGTEGTNRAIKVGG